MQEVSTQIVSDINGAHKQAQDYAAEAKARANMAIRFAMTCGKLLSQVREGLDGEAWLPWLDANCPEIGQRTALRYTKLTAIEDSAQMELGYKDATKAYVASGVLPEPVKAATATKTVKVDTYQIHINALLQHFSEANIKKLRPEQASIIANQIEDVLARLGERLQMVRRIASNE